MRQILVLLFMAFFASIQLNAQTVVYYKVDGNRAYYKIVKPGKENKFYRDHLKNGRISTDFKYVNNKISEEKYNAIESEERNLEEIGLTSEQKREKDLNNAQEAQSSSIMVNNKKDYYLYKSGTYLCKSAKMQYAAIGCGALSVAGWVLSCTAFKDNSLTKLKRSGSSKSGYSYSLSTAEDTNETKRKICYISSGVFAVSGLICELCAIDYKMKSGKNLKLSSKSDGVTLTYNF